MKPYPISTSKALRTGAGLGAITWTIYGAGEAFFSSVFPWVVPLSHGYLPLSKPFTVILLFAYAVLGAAVGAICGLFARRRTDISDENFRQITSTLCVMSVLFPLFGNFAIFYRYSVAVWVSSGLLLAAIAALVWRGAGNRLRFLVNPWTVVLLALGPPWLNWEIADAYSAFGQRILIGGYIAGVVLFSWLAARLFSSRGPSAFSPVATGVATLAAVGLTLLLGPKPAVAESFLKGPNTAGTGPNVLFIVLDTVRADHLSLYGYPLDTAPQMQRFAADASLYTHAISSSDMTLSTHASLFTGVYPSRHGAHLEPEHQWGRPLDDTFPTLAELLAAKGYATAAVIANYGYLSQAFGMGRGFQYYDSRAAVTILGETRNYYLRSRIRNVLSRYFPFSKTERLSRDADEINGEALHLLGRMRKDNRHFFLFLNYMDAHWPYLPPAPYDTRFPGRGKHISPSEFSAMGVRILQGRENLSDSQRRHLISQYDGSISYMDDRLGRLFDELKRQGIYDEMLVIVTSDHGEAFGEHNLIEHGVSTYQDQVHVPLLIKYPGKNRPRRIDAPASSIDLMPTVLETAGVPLPKSIDGKSLPRVSDYEPRTVFAESFPNAHFVAMNPRFRRIERAAVGSTFKLITATNGRREFYDVATDPGELRNFYAPQLPEIAKLGSDLNFWLKTLAQSKSGQTGVDRNAVERLRSLGYVQ